MNYRKPQDLKILTGTFRGDRDQGTVKSDTDLPEKVPTPSHLGSAGKRQWRKLVKLLEEDGLIKRVDLGCLEACCLAYDEMVQSSYDMKTQRKKMEEAEAEVYNVQEPDSIKARIALVKHHSQQIDKARNAKNKAMALYHKFMNEFGLSPGSRKRLDITEEKDDESEFEKMFGVSHAG
jgi:P27 family predicted phage terminase small subunit